VLNLSKKANFAPTQNLPFAGSQALFPRGFACRNPVFFYCCSGKADNRSFLTIDLDACGLRCPHPAQAASKAEHALH